MTLLHSKVVQLCKIEGWLDFTEHIESKSFQYILLMLRVLTLLGSVQYWQLLSNLSEQIHSDWAQLISILYTQKLQSKPLQQYQSCLHYNRQISNISRRRLQEMAHKCKTHAFVHRTFAADSKFVSNCSMGINLTHSYTTLLPNHLVRKVFMTHDH